MVFPSWRRAIPALLDMAGTLHGFSNLVPVPRTCLQMASKVLSPKAGSQGCFEEGTIPACWSRSGISANSTWHGASDATLTFF